jgi:hypothetical protein
MAQMIWKRCVMVNTQSRMDSGFASLRASSTQSAIICPVDNGFTYSALCARILDREGCSDNIQITPATSSLMFAKQYTPHNALPKWGFVHGHDISVSRRDPRNLMQQDGCDDEHTKGRQQRLGGDRHQFSHKDQGRLAKILSYLVFRSVGFARLMAKYRDRQIAKIIQQCTSVRSKQQFYTFAHQQVFQRGHMTIQSIM